MHSEYVYGRPWKFSRYPRGKSMPFGRMLYGYRISCPDCQHERRINDTKREARRAAASHYRYNHSKKARSND